MQEIVSAMGRARGGGRAVEDVGMQGAAPARGRARAEACRWLRGFGPGRLACRLDDQRFGGDGFPAGPGGFRFFAGVPWSGGGGFLQVRWEGPFEADTVNALVALPGDLGIAVALRGGRRGVDRAEFREQVGQRIEAVGAGVGLGEGFQRVEFIDGGDAQAAEAGREGDLARAHDGAGPEADGLPLLAGAYKFDEVSLE